MMMNHHSPAMRLVGKISWLVTSLAAVSMGLIGLGLSLGKSLNIWQSEFVVRNLEWAILPAHYVIGACGLISLLSFFMCMGCKDGHHDHKR